MCVRDTRVYSGILLGHNGCASASSFYCVAWPLCARSFSTVMEKVREIWASLSTWILPGYKPRYYKFPGAFTLSLAATFVFQEEGYISHSCCKSCIILFQRSSWYFLCVEFMFAFYIVFFISIWWGVWDLIFRVCVRNLHHYSQNVCKKYYIIPYIFYLSAITNR